MKKQTERCREDGSPVMIPRQTSRVKQQALHELDKAVQKEGSGAVSDLDGGASQGERNAVRPLWGWRTSHPKEPRGDDRIRGSPAAGKK